MLNVVLILTGGLALTCLLAFAILCVGIRRDDRVSGLDGPEPGLAAAMARRFTGLRVQQPGTQHVGWQAALAPSGDAQLRDRPEPEEGPAALYVSSPQGIRQELAPWTA